MTLTIHPFYRFYIVLVLFSVVELCWYDVTYLNRALIFFMLNIQLMLLVLISCDCPKCNFLKNGVLVRIFIVSERASFCVLCHVSVALCP